MSSEAREVYLERMRAQLAERRLCQHGIDLDRAVCKHRHDDPPPPGPVERDGTPPRAADHPATPPDHDTAPSAEEETEDA